MMYRLERAWARARRRLRPSRPNGRRRQEGRAWPRIELSDRAVALGASSFALTTLGLAAILAYGGPAATVGRLVPNQAAPRNSAVPGLHDGTPSPEPTQASTTMSTPTGDVPYEDPISAPAGQTAIPTSQIPASRRVPSPALTGGLSGGVPAPNSTTTSSGSSGSSTSASSSSSSSSAPVVPPLPVSVTVPSVVDSSQDAPDPSVTCKPRKHKPPKCRPMR